MKKENCSKAQLSVIQDGTSKTYWKILLRGKVFGKEYETHICTTDTPCISCNCFVLIIPSTVTCPNIANSTGTFNTGDSPC